MARARRIPGLAPETPFREAAARAIEVRAEEVWEHAAGVTDTSDIERVHAMRVATRRLRAMLEIFAPCFPADEHRKVLREVKALADALGERRDPDVALEFLDSLPEEIATAEGAGIERLRHEQRGRQRKGNELLERALVRAERKKLAKRVRRLVRAVA